MAEACTHFNTREEWLNFIAGRMAPMFKKLGAPLPKNVRISIGFTSTGKRGKSIGECWDSRCSEDGRFEIFIRPDLAKSKNVMPGRIADILAHELVHAAVGIPAGHGPAFRKVALGIGLEGKMKATTAGPAFKEALAPILTDAGPLPHGRLRASADKSTRPKTQTQRHIKCTCSECGYTARTSRKWIDELGPPHCPEHGAMNEEGA